MWKKVNLTEICKEIYAGGDAPKKNQFSKFKCKEYPIPIFSNGVKNKGLYGYTNYSRTKDNAITVSARGTIGHLELRNEPFLPIVRLIVLVPNQNLIDIEFLKFALHNSEIFSSGASIPQLTVPMIKKIEIHIPSLEKQKLITEGLNSSFSIIDKEIIHQKNKLDEIIELRENVFDKWFNDKNFKQHSLKDVCSFVGGSQPPKSTFQYEKNDENIRLIQIRDYKSDNNIVYIPIKKARKFCSISDVMIGRYGPPIFQILRGLEGAYNVALMKAIPKKNILNDYLFYFLKNRSIQKYVVEKSSRAAGQTGVNKDSLDPYPINLPSLEIQKDILEKVEKFNSQIEILLNLGQEKIQELLSLRRSILFDQMQNK